MTRKFLMITTAIVAFAATPVFAQGNGAASSAGAATATPPSMAQQQNQQKLQAPGSSLTTGGAATLNRQPMTRELQSGKTTTGQVAAGRAATGEVKTDAMKAKIGEMKADASMKTDPSMKTGKSAKTHKTSASMNHRSSAREMNNREIQATRDLNRQGLSGQQAMAPSTSNSMNMPMQSGTTANRMTSGGQGVSGPGNTADNPTTTK